MERVVTVHMSDHTEATLHSHLPQKRAGLSRNSPHVDMINQLKRKQNSTILKVHRVIRDHQMSQVWHSTCRETVLLLIKLI